MFNKLILCKGGGGQGRPSLTLPPTVTVILTTHNPAQK